MQRLQENIFIFDLDGTTIDSRHRQGETLEDWFRLNTPENVARDKPLLLAKAIRDLWESGFHVLICTSRTLSAWDMEYLYNRIYVPVAVKVIGRENSNMESHKLKKKQLSYLQNFKHFKHANKFLIDDDEQNRLSFEELGSNCWGLTPTSGARLIEHLKRDFN